MNQVYSFPPVVGTSPKVLVLGSMPGKRSLDAGQYYAHPRNGFWPIMAEIVGFDVNAPYVQRLEGLAGAGIALWDVLHSCVRPGSADNAIQNGTRVPNDFDSLFRDNPGIERICFNGAEAEKSFRRYVMPGLSGDSRRYLRLPSTSPAYAVLSLRQKLEAWRVGLGDLSGGF